MRGLTKGPFEFTAEVGRRQIDACGQIRHGEWFEGSRVHEVLGVKEPSSRGDIGHAQVCTESLPLELESTVGHDDVEPTGMQLVSQLVAHCGTTRSARLLNVAAEKPGQTVSRRGVGRDDHHGAEGFWFFAAIRVRNGADGRVQ